ncbi:MAG: hypothetical protein E7454_01600 [Ruminococcaceae bacterium]|nr:hypothetical protein [Oscillospiraceae bacterium]
MRRILAIILCFGLMGIPTAGAQEPRYVALTFDDGPSGRFTRRLLEGLEQREVAATFLLCGYRLKTYPKLAQQIFEAGHEIGLHGYSHQNMAKMSRHQLEKEIRDTRALLPEGCDAVFLRPPGGSETALVQKVAKEEGLSLLLWSVDPRDWAIHDAAAVEAAVVSQVQDGDVILLHDLSDSSVNAALSIVDRLQESGFRFVTVSQLAMLRNTPLQPGTVYTHFPQKKGNG